LGFSYRPVADWQHPAVRKIAAMALPILLLQVLIQVQVIFSNSLAASLTVGSNTSIALAGRIHFMVVGVFALSIVIASFPSLAEYAAKQKKQSFLDTLSQTIRMVVFISIPASAGILMLRIPLVSTLYEHGKFGPADTEAVAVPLVFFTLGILFQGLVMTVPRAFYALEDSWRPVLIGMFSMLVSMGLMLLFLKTFPPAYKTGGLALAVSLAAMVQSAILFVALRSRIGPMDGRRIFRSASLTVLATAIMAGGVGLWQYVLRNVVANWLPLAGYTKKLSSIAELTVGICIGFLVFMMAAKAFRMEEFRLMVETVSRKKTRTSVNSTGQ
jgi:putative peptidoglycan lipid II flippase